MEPEDRYAPALLRACERCGVDPMEAPQLVASLLADWHRAEGPPPDLRALYWCARDRMARLRASAGPGVDEGTEADWLSFERYALDEGSPTERLALEERTQRDPSAQAILETIRAAPPRSPPPVGPPAPANGRWWVWVLLAPVFAATATAILVLWLDPGSIPKPPSRAFRGSTALLEITRVREGKFAASPSEVATGDQLGLRITCRGGDTAVDVVIFHGGTARFPGDRTTLKCGTRVSIPGTFTVDTPGPLVACVAIGNLPPRSTLEQSPQRASLCVQREVGP